MGRPGPLQDLPLEQFLPPHTNVLNTPSKRLRSAKRPLSPATAALYSPAKRRILNEEGIFSSERTPKSPRSPARGRFATEHFDALLRGPDSPAKKLDFGTPKSAALASHSNSASMQSATDASLSTPRKPTPSTTKLAPSPELKSKSGTPRVLTRSSRVAHDNKAVAKDNLQSGHQSTSSRLASSRGPRVNAPPDRQSIHYPGFDVFCDASDASNTASKPPACQDMDIDGGEPHAATNALKREKDEDKENTRPRRKTHKAISAAAVPADVAWAKAGLLSPESRRKETERVLKAKTIPASPSMKGIYEVRESSATPTFRGLRLMDAPMDRTLNLSPSKMHIGVEERRLRRRAMEEEIDEDVYDDHT